MHTIIIIQTIYKEEELYHEKESNAFCVCIYTSFRTAYDIEWGFECCICSG